MGRKGGEIGEARDGVGLDELDELEWKLAAGSHVTPRHLVTRYSFGRLVNAAGVASPQRWTAAGRRCSRDAQRHGCQRHFCPFDGDRRHFYSAIRHARRHHCVFPHETALTFYGLTGLDTATARSR